jgi:methyl-CpG-binding domain protein 4
VSFQPTQDNRILQEVYQDDPWRMLVGCILLNLTTRAQVDRVREELFERWPYSLALAEAITDDLAEVIRPLGLYRRRAVTLRRFSSDWYESERMPEPGHVWPSVEQVSDMYGIGKYALDSYKIFVLRWPMAPEDVDDRVLKRYLELTQVVKQAKKV